MEKYIEDFTHEDECSCKNILFTYKSMLEIFIHKNREYFKLEADLKRNILKISKKEFEIETIIKNFSKKYSQLTEIKSCLVTSHDKIAFDFEHLIDDTKRMINSFYRQKEEKCKIILQNNFEDYSDGEYESNYNLETNLNKQNNEENSKKKVYFIKDGMETEEEKYFLENTLNTGDFGEIDILTLEDILEKNSKEYEGDIEFRKNLIQFKNKIQDFSHELTVQIDKSNQQIDEILEINSEVSENIDIANKDLKCAALETNKINRFKYPLIFGGVGGSLGLILPGFGTIIGGSIGILLGNYIAKMEKKQIEKIESGK